jgi:hypothetical protein
MSFTLLKDQLRMIYHVLTYINHKTSTPSLFFIFILVHFIDSSHVNHYNLLNAAWLWSHSHICFLHYHYLTIFILHYCHSSFTIIPLYFVFLLVLLTMLNFFCLVLESLTTKLTHTKDYWGSNSRPYISNVSFKLYLCNAYYDQFCHP